MILQDGTRQRRWWRDGEPRDHVRDGPQDRTKAQSTRTDCELGSTRKEREQMQTAMKKAARIGRTTMLAIGVGVVLALVLGLATAALAAVPGDPFKLGQVNTINNATTALRGSFQGLPVGTRPVLEVVQGQGSGGPPMRGEKAPGGIGRGGERNKGAPGNTPPN